MTKEFDHKHGMHPSYPDIGTDLTEKHGTPSEMHAPGVDRYISKQPYPTKMTSVK